MKSSTVTLAGLVASVLLVGLGGAAGPDANLVATDVVAMTGTETGADMTSSPGADIWAAGDAGPGASAAPSATPSRSPRADVRGPKQIIAPRPGKSLKPVTSDNLAGRLRHLPSDTRQVVIVHAPSSATTYATVETFVKAGRMWMRQFAAMPARVGKNGIGAHPREGVPTTPVGMYGFGVTMYGVKANPGVRYAWHHLVSGDWWDENSSSPTYNTFVHGDDPGGASEALWQITPAYNYFAVIAFNMPDPTPGAGSGIFLHVGTGGPTAGCVSLASADLVKVLTWLDPSKDPRIVIALDGDLKNY